MSERSRRRPAGAVRPRPGARLGAILLLASTACIADTGWSSPSSWWPSGADASAAGPETSAFRAVAPCRVGDTRSGHGIESIADDRVRVAIGGRCAVPAHAIAAALTVTVVDATAAGHVTVWPAGEPLPDASTVNVDAGEIRANGAIVRLGRPPGGGAGAIDVRSSVTAHLVVDVTGWFEPVSSSTAGRFVSVSPTRLLDTRDVAAPFAAGETRVVARPHGVPDDAVALAVNVTVTAPSGPGFITLHRSAEPLPESSVLNTDGWDQTRSAASIAPIDPGGLAVHSSAGGHVIVDVTGWFTGDSAVASSDGLFVPVSPVRVIDTRHGDPVWPGGGVELAPIAGAAAVALNVTMVNPEAWNFVTARPSRTPPPATSTSTVNVDRRNGVAANLALVPQSDAGVAITSHVRADVVADLAGWFVGTPFAGDGAAPENVRPPVCAADASSASLSALLRSDRLFIGADYQRTIALPDGRTLWLFQDVFVPTRHGSHHVHNAAAVQTGACFHLLHGGSYAAPTPLVLAAETERYRRWFWPLGGTVGTDGDVHVFMAEMLERGGSYLTRTEPISTRLVRLDGATLDVVASGPAPNPTADLYGWSVVTHGAHTYLYAHCYRQFGFDPLVFSDPLRHIHDSRCAGNVTVARVPAGEPWATPQYWNGSAWQPNHTLAVPVIPRSDDRRINPTQVHHDGTRFVAVTKEGDWWGDTIYVDVADAAQGPWRTIRAIPVAQRCGDCNTYFASFVAPPTPGRLTLGLSNNVFTGNDPTAYFPVVFDVDL